MNPFISSQVSLIDEKAGDRISRWTVPLSLAAPPATIHKNLEALSPQIFETKILYLFIIIYYL